ncbi:uncharacterized protein FMAN_07178 [Fusarium mangiferae]|uniref:Uncharacterized protein n=1 Tax=Fusarium mangiferae TaxID=192010 RepID=A0A1L7TAI4_FUSMA|nr:uncharacterized protein FMAN_07178 [Fusarium mangiferae]CVK92247.1 uncharacterized protein FMAN_07178 [Fusarium mangiferae]
MALAAAKRAMFAVFSSKGNGPKTRTALNPLRDLIQECPDEGIVNIITSGTSYMAVLYNSTSPAVAIPDSVASQDEEAPASSTQKHILNHDDGYSEH